MGHDVETGSDRTERLLPLLGVVLTGVMVAMSYVSNDRGHPRALDLVGIGLLIVTAAAVVAVRRWTLWSLTVSLVASAIWFPRGYAGAWPAVGLVVAIYMTTRTAATRRPVIGAVAVTTVSAASMLVAGVDSFVTAVGILGWMVAAALLGDAVRKRSDLVAAHRAQLASVRAEQAAIADRRIAEDRLAVARDLHDVLAHTLAAVSLHAGAAADLVAANEPAAQHLALVRRSINDAVTDLRTSIAGLRYDTPADPVPGWLSLAHLLDECNETGPVVHRRVDGIDLDQLPDLIGVCTYRLVQEGITNIRRHSQATSATLHIGADHAGLHITLEDPGPRRLPTSSPGHGLTGLAERVGAAGGTLTTGPTPRGGFRITADFPTVRERA